MRDTQNRLIDERIKQAKLAIQRRGYAHSNEIDILWSAPNIFGNKIRWKKLFAIALILSGGFILLAKLFQN